MDSEERDQIPEENQQVACEEPQPEPEMSDETPEEESEETTPEIEQN